MVDIDTSQGSSEGSQAFETPSAATPVVAVRRDLRPSTLSFISEGSVDQSREELDSTVRVSSSARQTPGGKWPPGRSPAPGEGNSQGDSLAQLLTSLPDTSMDNTSKTGSTGRRTRSSNPDLAAVEALSESIKQTHTERALEHRRAAAVLDNLEDVLRTFEAKPTAALYARVSSLLAEASDARKAVHDAHARYLSVRIKLDEVEHEEWDEKRLQEETASHDKWIDVFRASYGRVKAGADAVQARHSDLSPDAFRIAEKSAHSQGGQQQQQQQQPAQQPQVQQPQQAVQQQQPQPPPQQPAAQPPPQAEQRQQQEQQSQKDKEAAAAAAAAATAKTAAEKEKQRQKKRLEKEKEEKLRQQQLEKQKAAAIAEKVRVAKEQAEAAEREKQRLTQQRDAAAAAAEKAQREQREKERAAAERARAAQEEERRRAAAAAAEEQRRQRQLSPQKKSGGSSCAASKKRHASLKSSSSGSSESNRWQGKQLKQLSPTPGGGCRGSFRKSKHGGTQSKLKWNS